MKKVVSVIINAICILMIVAAIFLLGTVVLNKGQEQPAILGFSLFRVLTASMEPNIPVNSLVVVKETDPEEIKIGDIITFHSKDPTLAGSTNTHRVVAIDDSSGSPVFTTKGDNSIAEDRYTVSGADLIGKVVFVSGIIGVVMSLVSNPLLFGAIIVIPLAIIFIVNIKDLVKSAKKLEVLEIIEAIEESGNDKTPIAFDDSEDSDGSGNAVMSADSSPIPLDADPVIDDESDASPIEWQSEEEK